MTKDEIKTICNTNDKLQWWAMVLFAEISETIKCRLQYNYEDRIILDVIEGKVKEFPLLVIQNTYEEAKKKSESKL